MPSPLPQKSAIRNNARPDWTVLPYEGRSGKPPAWPLERNPAGATARWRALWAMPQAVMWQDLHLERVVARYVLTLIVCEDSHHPQWTAAILGESRQLEDRLGLSAMAMRRLQWEMAEKPSSAVSGPVSGVSSLSDYRDL